MNLLEEMVKWREEYKSVFDLQEALLRTQEILEVYGTIQRILNPPPTTILTAGTHSKENNHYE